MMFISPSGEMFGMDPMLPYMKWLPFSDILFQDFIFSGIMLIVVNGVCNTVAFVGLLKRRRYGVVCGFLSGIMLLCWLSVQWVIFDVNPMTTAYTVFGAVQILLARSVLLAPYKHS